MGIEFHFGEVKDGENMYAQLRVRICSPSLNEVTLIGGKSVGSMGSIQFLIIMRLGWGWNPHFLVII